MQSSQFLIETAFYHVGCVEPDGRSNDKVHFHLLCLLEPFRSSRMGSEASRSVGKTTVFLSWFDIFMPKDFTIWCPSRLILVIALALRGAYVPSLSHQRWHFQNLGDGIQCLSMFSMSDRFALPLLPIGGPLD